MARGVSIQSKGLNRLIKRLSKINPQLEKEADAVLHAASTDMERWAAEDAPKDETRLSSAIASDHAHLKHDVKAPVKYAAWIEFGTKKKAKIPAGLEQIAAQFQGGTGGTFEDLLKQIEGWVKRKGIAANYATEGKFSVKTRRRVGNTKKRDEEEGQVAYMIALSIAKNGINPHPYFFHNYYKAADQAVTELKQVLKDVLK